MTNQKSARESGRSRRLALIFLGILIVVTATKAAHDDVSWTIDESYERPDSENAAQLLQAVTGANEILCSAVERAFNNGYWGGMEGILDTPMSPDAAETARWIGRRHIDKTALDVARRGLASGDACVRKIAALITGNINIDRLDQALSQELESASAQTRAAAILALGHAEQQSSLPTLRRLINDNDRTIRVTAIWAIARLEAPETLPMFVSLLQKDGDPEVRRVAAWALGQMK
jgi:hypothetical protein